MDLAERQALGEDLSPDQRHPWEQARSQELVRVLKSLSKDLGSVLDVGCGDAYVLSQVLAALPGTQCIGVDSAYPEPTRTCEGIQLYSHLNQVEVEQPVGVVLLMDVLEHIEDPVAFLRDLRRQPYLSPETRIYATVPAWSWLYSQHDHWLGHFRRYSRLSLVDHLSQGGVHVLQSGYLFHCLLPVRVAEVILEKTGLVKQTSTGLVRWKGGRWLSRLLAAMLRWDAALGRLVHRWLGWHLPGLSCFALGRLS